MFKKAPHDMADGSQALQELESRIRYRTTEDGGDSTRLAEHARNLRNEYQAAKTSWTARMGALDEHKQDSSTAMPEVLVLDEDKAGQHTGGEQ
jgi:hypothetical protein